MTVNFNDFNYDKYRLAMFNANKKEAPKAEKEQEIVKADVQFRGLKNEEDLLTQNSQNVFGVKLGRFTTEDAQMAQETNAILKSLGYDYKVTATQVAGVTATMKTIVEPDLKLVEDGAVVLNIQDPNGPFADLFA